mmetsp:Transcript_15197/g.61063  ORF Transcript_15197/g.61063 Transcript_15197/m.61063 type:complete len:361 (-) Transcript_15197:48-1130(-)
MLTTRSAARVGDVVMVGGLFFLRVRCDGRQVLSSSATAGVCVVVVTAPPGARPRDSAASPAGPRWIACSASSTSTTTEDRTASTSFCRPTRRSSDNGMVETTTITENPSSRSPSQTEEHYFPDHYVDFEGRRTLEMRDIASLRGGRVARPGLGERPEGHRPWCSSSSSSSSTCSSSRSSSERSSRRWPREMRARGRRRGPRARAGLGRTAGRRPPPNNTRPPLPPPRNSIARGGAATTVGCCRGAPSAARRAGRRPPERASRATPAARAATTTRGRTRGPRGRRAWGTASPGTPRRGRGHLDTRPNPRPRRESTGRAGRRRTECAPARATDTPPCDGGAAGGCGAMMTAASRRSRRACAE